MPIFFPYFYRTNSASHSFCENAASEIVVGPFSLILVRVLDKFISFHRKCTSDNILTLFTDRNDVFKLMNDTRSDKCKSDKCVKRSDKDLDNKGNKIKILLVEDHAAIRMGLSGLLSLYDDLIVIGEASDGPEAIQIARDRCPDVILMDVKIPKLNGIKATRIIKNELPTVRIIGLTMFDDPDIKAAMDDAGAFACISKARNSEKLLSLIRAGADC